MTAERSGAVRVLLVEDDRDDYEIVMDLLEDTAADRRYEVRWVSTFAEGIAALTEGAHDVCLLDYMLGARDGIDLLTEAIRRGIRVPIIFLTGRGNPGIEQQALAAGAADYLVKGEIDTGALERSIRHSLERARSMEETRDRDRLFRAVFEGALDAMLIVDDDGRVVDGNDAALSLLGVKRAKLLTLDVLDLTPPEDRDGARRAWPSFLREGRIEGERRIQRPDGTTRIVEHRATAAILPGRHLSVLRDVTEKKLVEHQRLRLAAMVESAADSIEGLTLEGIIDYWSPASERLYGHRAWDALGKTGRLVVPDEKLAELEEMLCRVRAGEAIRDHETVRRRKDGTTFQASVTFSPVREDGRIVAASVITRDIAEKKKLEAQLATSERMASLGALAAGVAHEINNPLAAVIVSLDLLAQELHASAGRNRTPLGCTCLHDVTEPLSDARASADRIRHIVRDLKLFSRPDEDERGPVDLRRVIELSLRMASNEIRHRALVVTQFGNVPPVFGNEARLGQVFLNLLVNAAHSIVEGNAERNEIRVVTRRSDDGRVMVEVRDTGAGITPETLEQQFEPFLTTKAGAGTGLGLSICRRIVLDHGGTITAESTPGHGATFRIVLPAAAAPQAVPAPGLAPFAVNTRRGRVLVIDDEPIIGKVVQRTLEPPHAVTTVTSGAEALELLRAGHRYDVILCDMMMPQMTGMDFYGALSKELPESARAVVFLTGGAFTPLARAFLEGVRNACVEKPFDAFELRIMVDELVAATSAEKGKS